MAVKVDEKQESKVQGKQSTKKAESLPPCDKPHVAEASRNEEEDEACDDGIH
jgi:hypothetical protein